MRKLLLLLVTCCLCFHSMTSVNLSTYIGGKPASMSCAACVVVVSLVEQLTQLHNSTVSAAMERLCNYLPDELHLKMICHKLFHYLGPDIIKLLIHEINADIVCHAIKVCNQDPKQGVCHIYKYTKEKLHEDVRKAEWILKDSNALRKMKALPGICTLKALKWFCQQIETSFKKHTPLEDLDLDNFSDIPTFRGYHWRGKDCNDGNNKIYPGRRPADWDKHVDSNCNGIWGTDPEDGIPYEKKFCEGSEPRGLILLGDSAGAHFHIPPEWLTATQLSAEIFANLPLALSNELDWPQFSSYTGFQNSTIGGWTESLYLYLRKRNHCNHRDYQNIAANGESSGKIIHTLESLTRDHLQDYPVVVVYEMIGNDVCNNAPDTVASMTTPEEMRKNVMSTLKYLNSHLPKQSHIILFGLADGRFLWNHLHRRYHPLGQLNKDITYAQMYAFLECLQISPCRGWMSSNETLRNITSKRAMQLSNVMKEVSETATFDNINLHYVDYPQKQVKEKWLKMGGEYWQLIEPVDGFHPNQFALALGAEVIWHEVLKKWPEVFGKKNPHNKWIEKIFGNQNGY